MYYPEEIVEEVRNRSDIVDVISEYVKLQRKGSTYFGLCPFHNEKSPSFSVTPSKQMYYCFGCGAGGNVFTFVKEYENFTFPEALKLLADRAGVELPEIEYSQEAKKQADLKGTLLEMYKQAATFYYKQLFSDKGRIGYDYLKSRELSDETMKHFGLGYAGKFSSGIYEELKQKGYSDELIKESGLVTMEESKGAFDRFWNRVIFPIMDVNNRVIGFGGRVMGEGKPKYLNSPETKIFDKSRNLYGLNFARTSRKQNMLICEGYMDVIALHQAGFTNAVASLGTAFTVGHASLLKRYTNEVLLTYDSDDAGVMAALRAIPNCKAAGLSVKVINLRPYKDPDEFIKGMGIKAFEERIEQAVSSFFYEIEVMEKNYDLKNPEEKTGFFNEIAHKLLEFQEEIERNNYIEAVAEKYNIGFENLRNLVNRLAMKLSGVKETEKPKSGKNRNKEKEDGMRQSQKLLLTWLIENDKVYRIIKNYIEPEDFTEELYCKVAGLLFEQLETGRMQPAKIIDYFTEEEEQREIAGIFNAKLDEIETLEEREKALKETIVRVKKNSYEHQNSLLDPTDMKGLQLSLIRKKALQDLERLNISLG